MSAFLTEKEIEQVFNARKHAKFELLQTTNKITFEFSVDESEKARFLHLVAVLSDVEFMVDVILDNIWIKKANDNKLLFKIKASGTKDNLNRWNGNLLCVASFLNGDHGITHIKNSNVEEELCV